MAKIGKIDTECKLRTSYYLSAAAGGGVYIKIYLISPIPPSLAVNFLKSPLYTLLVTLPSLSVPPEKPSDPPIYFFNPLQRLEGMTLIFLFKSSPPSRLKSEQFRTNLDNTKQ